MVSNIDKVLQRSEKLDILVDKTAKLDEVWKQCTVCHRKIRNLWHCAHTQRMLVDCMLVILDDICLQKAIYSPTSFHVVEEDKNAGYDLCCHCDCNIYYYCIGLWRIIVSGLLMEGWLRMRNGDWEIVFWPPMWVEYCSSFCCYSSLLYVDVATSVMTSCSVGRSLLVTLSVSLLHACISTVIYIVVFECLLRMHMWCGTTMTRTSPRFIAMECPSASACEWFGCSVVFKIRWYYCVAAAVGDVVARERHSSG